MRVLPLRGTTTFHMVRTALPMQVVLVSHPEMCPLFTGPVPCDNRNQPIPPICRLGHEEHHSHHQDPKEDGTDPKRPAIPIQLNNVASDQRTAADPRQQEQVPHRDPRSALVHEVHVPDGALDQDLVRRHPHARHDAAGEEGRVGRHRGAPGAGGEHDADGEDVHGAAADHLGERVGDEEGEADGQDQPGRGLG